MNEIQEAALIVLKEFQRICKKYNLMYFAIGGTCIGAVRHSGFIPWDDDIDIAMPYADYKTFLELSKTELNEEYGLLGPDNCKHYISIYSKLQNTKTTFIESFVEKYPDRYGGIYIDVFPVFGLPDGYNKQNLLSIRCEIQNFINMRMRFPFNDYDSLVWKLSWILCSPLRLLLPFNYFTKKQEKMLGKYSYDDSDKIIFSWRERPSRRNKTSYKMIFYYEDFKATVEKPFEDITINIPVGYDRYLTMDFGDYMMLPPEDKRTPGHPKAIVDLKRPYEYYKKLKEK